MTRSGEAIKALFAALDDATDISRYQHESAPLKAGRYLDVLTAHIDDLRAAVAEEERK